METLCNPATRLPCNFAVENSGDGQDLPHGSNHSGQLS